MPLYVIAELASTEAVGNAAVATMLVTGAAGTLVGGRLADRYGFRPVVVWSLALGMPLALALPFVGVTGMFLVMGAIGFVEGMNFYPLVVIAQNALPGYLGLAAGVVLGLAIGIGAGTVALLGVLADATGLTAVLWVLVGVTALGWLLAARLPPERGAVGAPVGGCYRGRGVTGSLDHPKPPADGCETRYPDGPFDAILVVSFGGPEGPDDVMPFLEQVTRGRGVPRERLEEVAHHYELFGGVSPLNGQNRALVEALRAELDAHGHRAPDLLRQPQLAPVPRRHPAGDGRGRGRARARVRHLRVLELRRLPPLPRGDLRRAGRGRPARARRS